MRAGQFVWVIGITALGVLIVLLTLCMSTLALCMSTLGAWMRGKGQLVRLIGITALGVLVFSVWISAWGLTTDKLTGLSAEGTIGLAVLVAALAAVVNWFSSKSPNGQPDPDAQPGIVTTIGRLFLLSALCLTLLAMLIPAVNYIRVHPNNPAWVDKFLQFVALCALFLGTLPLVIGVFWGIYEILRQFFFDMKRRGLIPSLPRRLTRRDLGWLLIWCCLVMASMVVAQRHSVPWVIGGSILTFIMFLTGLCLIRRSNRGG